MSRQTSRFNQPFKSGFCAYAPNHVKCKGEYENGALVKPRVTLCSCPCHGSYSERLEAAGQINLEDAEEEVEDDD